VLIAEVGILEAQAVLLCESIRRFAGKYSQAAVTVVSPRPDRRPSAPARRAFTAFAAKFRELDIETSCTDYLTSSGVSNTRSALSCGLGDLRGSKDPCGTLPCPRIRWTAAEILACSLLLCRMMSTSVIVASGVYCWASSARPLASAGQMRGLLFRLPFLRPLFGRHPPPGMGLSDKKIKNLGSINIALIN
jgi:hypothetical protein